MKSSTRYQEILNLPHPVSRKYPQMPVADRAAQFAPFAALTGRRKGVIQTESEGGKLAE